ncbi:MAG: CBS domain-containing protein [Acidobacteriota bacterium]|nr:CBS domain-containing protein [Acidobacteriota bacterium]
MEIEVLAVREDDALEDVSQRLQQAHVHGAPVISPDGELVGFVTQGDVLIGSLGVGDSDSERDVPRVRDVMTSPAVSANEDTPIAELCKVMWRFRLHHVPIVNDGKIKGIVSSLDLCRAIADGDIET